MTIMTDKAMPAMPGLPAARAAACKRVGWCVKPSIVRFGLCLICWALPMLASAKEPAVGVPQEGEVAFESKVRPLLVAKCQSCHGEKLAEAGLRLDSRRSVLIGGESGAVVVPGDAAQGKLLDAVRHVGLLAMPPDDTLSADDIAVLEKWIAAGLPWSGPGGDAPVDTGPATHTPDHPADMEQRLATAAGNALGLYTTPATRCSRSAAVATARLAHHGEQGRLEHIPDRSVHRGPNHCCWS